MSSILEIPETLREVASLDQIDGDFRYLQYNAGFNYLIRGLDAIRLTVLSKQNGQPLGVSCYALWGCDDLSVLLAKYNENPPRQIRWCVDDNGTTLRPSEIERFTEHQVFEDSESLADFLYAEVRAKQFPQQAPQAE